jgi:hypothetical protein
MKIHNLARRLKSHDRDCKIYTHEETCSCGRDEALEELDELIASQLPELTGQQMTVQQIKRRLARATPSPRSQA